MLYRASLFFLAGLLALSWSQEKAPPEEALRKLQRLTSVLQAVADLRTAPQETAEERAKAAKCLSNFPDWKEVLHPYVSWVVRRAQWTDEDQKNFATRLAAAKAKLEDTRDANGGVIDEAHPAAKAVKMIEKERDTCLSARRELRSFMENLALAPSDEAIQLIAPVLEAKGVEVRKAGGDWQPPCQVIALAALRRMQLSELTFKGAAPGAKELLAFRKERSERGAAVPFPKIPSEFADWRRWWAGVRPDYKSDFELPADLRAPAPPAAEK